MAKSQEIETTQFNRIVSGTTITGDIISKEGIRLDGKLIGNLSTEGKLVVGATGEIRGEITCHNSDVEGTIEGKITVKELLSLKSTSKIQGDIITNKLAVEPGSKFTGTCNMGNGNGTKETQKTAK